MTILSLDVGTTTITGVLLATARRAVLRLAQRRNDAALKTGEPLHAEQDPRRLRALTLEVLRELVAAGALGYHEPLQGLVLTGQKHGLLCVDAQNEPLSPLVTWQDRRTAAPLAGAAEDNPTAWAELQDRVADLDWHPNGCRIQHGYGAATLFWLVARDALPARTQRVCTIAGWLAGQLAGQAAVTDPTFAASWGIFDLVQGCWNRAFLERLGLEAWLFPPVRPSVEQLGGLATTFARQVGLPGGLAVFNSLGDTQASYLGSTVEAGSAVQASSGVQPRPRGKTALVNLGTGGQICWAVPSFELPSEAVETRPLPLAQPRPGPGKPSGADAGQGFLRVGASLCGGAAYAWLNQTVRAWLAEFGVQADEEQVYEHLNALAADGSDTRGLRVRTTFLGVRGDPSVDAGAIEGIRLDNMTLGAVARATLTGMVDEIHGLYAAHGGPQAGVRQVVAGGGAVARNPLLGTLIEQRFALPVRQPAHPEPAAVGAAWLAGSQL